MLVGVTEELGEEGLGSWVLGVVDPEHPAGLEIHLVAGHDLGAHEPCGGFHGTQRDLPSGTAIVEVGGHVWRRKGHGTGLWCVGRDAGSRGRLRVNRRLRHSANWRIRVNRGRMQV